MIDQVVQHFGTQVAVARELGVSKVAVHHWIKAAGVPALRAVQIEKLTAGKFKAVDLIGDYTGQGANTNVCKSCGRERPRKS